MKPMKSAAESLVQSVKNQLMLAGPANVEGWEDLMNLAELLNEEIAYAFKNGYEDTEELEQLKVAHTVLRDQYTDLCKDLKERRYVAESYAVDTRKQIKDFQERVSELIGESRELKKSVEFANTNVGILDDTICKLVDQMTERDAEISKLKDQVKVYQQTIADQVGLQQRSTNSKAETEELSGG